MSATTRKRKLAATAALMKGWQVRIEDNLRINQAPQSYQYNGTQVTVSEGNQWPPPKGAKLIDRGGKFYTSKSHLVSPTVMPFTILQKMRIPGDNTWWYFYEGPLLPLVPGQTNAGVPFPPSMESSDSALDKDGATAISRCKPTNSIADASTFLGELMKEGLPSLIGSQLWKSKTAAARRKSAGGEYLNVQFGWAPIVGEITKFGEAIRKSDAVLKQYERDAGRVVRRRYYFPTETSSSEEAVSDSTQYLHGGGSYQALRALGTGKVFRKREIVRKKWFSGAFTYHLPSGYESRNGMSRLAAQADKLFGIKPTPETLWNLAPWSWAADWFANTGDVISNLEDFKLYGLVMRYGYMMETTIVTDTYTWVPNTPLIGGISAPVVSPIVLRTETKKRRPANPFGFGVSWDGLSSFQLSIAAALGISRR